MNQLSWLVHFFELSETIFTNTNLPAKLLGKQRIIFPLSDLNFRFILLEVLWNSNHFQQWHLSLTRPFRPPVQSSRQSFRQSDTGDHIRFQQSRRLSTPVFKVQIIYSQSSWMRISEQFTHKELRDQCLFNKVTSKSPPPPSIDLGGTAAHLI